LCFSEQLFLPEVYNVDFASNPGKEDFGMWNVSFTIQASLKKKIILLLSQIT